MEFAKETLSIEKMECALKGSREDKWRMLLIEDGIMQIFCEEKFYLLSKNECLLIPPYSFLAGFPKNKNLSYLIATFDAEEEVLPCAYSLPSALSDGLFAYRNEPECAPLLTLALLQKDRVRSIEPLSPHGNASLFLKAAAILEERYLDAPSVENLAAELSLSLSKLKRLFARYAGIGTHEYLMELRVALGKQALKDGRSVTETAALCGFANQAYFSAAFKKSTGSSPKEYLSKEEPTAPTPKKPQKKNAPRPSAKRDMPNYLL